MSANLTKYPMDDTPISDGRRFRVPKGVRDELGLGGVVRVRLPAFEKRFSAPIDSRGRITIPDHLREKYGIESMAEIDVEILVEDDE